MHETLLIKNILHYLDKEEKSSSRRIKRICLLLSEFGGISAEHFREHYKEQSRGTKWESLELEIKRIPYGAELEVTQLDFE